MGTNYYLLEKPTCSHCGRGPTEGLHIGKSSAGWCFSLHVYPSGGRETYKLTDYGLGVESIMSPNDWKPLFEKYGIVNEYGDTITPADMMKIINNRFPNYAIDKKCYDPSPRGPASGVGGTTEKNGKVLIRHLVDHSHCIGHGAGTWDQIVGEFS